MLPDLEHAQVRVSLTFDNGPHVEVTPRVLDMLAEYDISATFFVVGRCLSDSAGRQLMARTHDAGHRIGNHSMSHTTPLGLMPDTEAIAEIASTAALLGDYAHERLFRPFGRRGVIGPHMINAAAWNYLIERRYSCILWNCLAREWERPDDWAAPTLADCETRESSVIVIHDILRSVPAQLERLLAGLLERNCQFSQEFPDDCVALRDGVPTAAASLLVPRA